MTRTVRPLPSGLSFSPYPFTPLFQQKQPSCYVFGGRGVIMFVESMSIGGRCSEDPLMKRWFGLFIVACAASAAVAQAPFTIVRPADGSKVREKVHILIPKSSIPPGGYIGLFLNHKF